MTEAEMHPLLIEMRGMRAEMKAMREQNELLFKRVGQVLGDLGSIEKTLLDLRSDITLLENHNLTRHNEILQAFQRIERLEQD